MSRLLFPAIGLLIALFFFIREPSVDLPQTVFAKVDMPLPPIALDSLVADKTTLPDNPFLLVFWATWCPTCTAEHSYLHTVASSIPLVGIAVRDDSQKVYDFLAARGNPFRAVFHDSNGQYSKSLGAHGTPTVFFVDSQKTIRARLTGGLNKRRWIDKELNRFALSLADSRL